MADRVPTKLRDVQILDANGVLPDAQSIVRLGGAHRDKVVKRYGRKRSRFRQWCVQLGSWTVAAKSGTWASARRDNERACIRLWREHGFDTFIPVDPDAVASALESGAAFLVLRHEPGDRLYDLLLDGEDEAAVERYLARFARESSRRHALALSLREPRLLHEHGSFRHIQVSGDRLIYFDFEISWTRRRRVETLASRELASFLRSLKRASHPTGRFRSRLGTVLAHYDDRAQLARLLDRQLRWVNRLARAVSTGRNNRGTPYERSAVVAEARALLRTAHSGVRGTGAPCSRRSR